MGRKDAHVSLCQRLICLSASLSFNFLHRKISTPNASNMTGPKDLRPSAAYFGLSGKLSGSETSTTMSSQSSLSSSEPTSKFDELVEALRQKLGPCSGIDSEDVDENELQSLMEEYISNESEWAKYKFEKPNLPYTRNLVDKGNGKCNLVCRIWTIDQIAG